MKTPVPKEAAFVIAAKVAGRLYGVLDTAREITLSASNAKSIAARGGDKTAGFRPITDYVNEMARDTIALVSRINQTALDISVTAVKRIRSEDARRRFSDALDRQPPEQRNKRLSALLAGLDARIVGYGQHEQRMIAQLTGLFEDIDQRTRASLIIATNSRIEASRASEFQPYLESIADNVERASTAIQQEIATCRHYLSDLNKAMPVP